MADSPRPPGIRTLRTERQDRLDLLIFDAYRDGHRRDYFRVLRRVLGGRIVWGRPGRHWPRLLAARALVCSTCDDYLPAFFVLSLLRSLLGRTTLGLSIRSETIFQRTGLAQAMKRTMLRTLRFLPCVKVVTFMPHWAEPRLARYTVDWMYDLQYWDLAWLNVPAVNSLATLHETIRMKAAGRQVVTSVGHQRLVKGVEYFMALFEQEEMRRQFLFVCVGPNWDLDKAKVEQFRSAGGLFIDRELRDDEIVPIYAMTDVVWACYRPDYDQSSGIFGRAMQLGKPCIVREGSYLSVLQAGLGKQGAAVTYGQPEQAAAMLAAGVMGNRQAQHVVDTARTTGALFRFLGLVDRPAFAPGRPAAETESADRRCQ
ncbi:MAG: hypothetical protein Q7U99_19780 [Rubrivivax sp.]|nr:hypothetical protein [Rubrivivax sp.]